LPVVETVAKNYSKKWARGIREGRVGMMRRSLKACERGEAGGGGIAAYLC